MPIFISYSHVDGEWVHQYLVPVLRAAGAEVLIDTERFTAGKAIGGQMDDAQDQADIQILVITEPYLKSNYCRHEMKRAIATDSDFSQGRVMPVRRDAVDLPACLAPNKKLGTEPIYVDLQNDKDPAPWNLLWKSCRLHLMDISAPHWFEAIKKARKHLQLRESVNLVTGRTELSTYGSMLNEIKRGHDDLMIDIDLSSPLSMTRRDVFSSICSSLGDKNKIPNDPDDIVYLHNFLSKRKKETYLIIRNLDVIIHRKDRYNLADFYVFATLDYG